MESFIKQYNIDLKLCDQLIKYYKKNTEYKSLVIHYSAKTKTSVVDKNHKDSIDVTFFNNSQNKTINKYFDILTQLVTDYIKHFNLNYGVRSCDSGTNIQFYPKNGGFKTWHTERSNIKNSKRALVFMTYLNDINDGGETEFLYQKIKIKPKKGLSLIWPTDFTHTHRGIPSPTEEKMIVTGWLDFV